MPVDKVVAVVAVMIWAGCLAWGDCKTRTLPNLWTMGGAAVALVFRAGFGGIPLFLDGFAAACVAGAFLLIPFLLRGAGGGDVKMLFAAGAVVGWGGLFELLWVTSLAGVVMAVVMLIAGELDPARLKHYLRCAFDWRYDRAAGAAVLLPKDSARFRVPFSVPIAVGLLAAML
ncbi:MAG: A24 family peptidase [Kiritimatiellae bacterium]|nr:A24 family peptidase [Kiritimatiellia bacterium]